MKPIDLSDLETDRDSKSFERLPNRPLTLEPSESLNPNLNRVDRETQAAPAPEAPVIPDPPTEPEPSQPKPRSSKRKLIGLAVGAVALVVGSVSGIRWWQFQRTHVSTENAEIQGHLSPIAPRIPATVKQVLVEDGEQVKAGQPLVILEDQDLALRLQQAEARLSVAKAQLQSAADTIPLTSQTATARVQQSQARLSASQSSITAAQAAAEQARAAIATNQAKVDQAQTDVNRTQTDLRRYETLYQEGAIPAQQRDVARAAYETARANLAAAQRTVAQSQAALSNAQAQVQAAQAESQAASGQVTENQAGQQNVTIQQDQRQLAQAQVRQAEAELALARQQLQYTVIKAPVEGVVGQLTAQVGQRVQTGQALLALVPLKPSEVYIEANFKETALGKLHPGQVAEVEADAYPGQVFQARIAGISPATGAKFALIPPDNATGNFNKVVQWVPVRLTFEPGTDPQHKLRPGLSVHVTVDVKE